MRVRRWGVWLTQAHFTVTAGAVVLDGRRRVLLLKHAFRRGSGWGIPGGFLEKGEQPEEAIRRELREEVRLEVDDLRLAFARTVRHVRRLEIIFCARAKNEPVPGSGEIERAEWFARDALPPGLGSDQRRLIARALADGAGAPE